MKKTKFKIIGAVVFVTVIAVNLIINKSENKRMFLLENLDSIALAEGEEMNIAPDCCLGWGYSCGYDCIMRPGQTEAFWLWSA